MYSDSTLTHLPNVYKILNEEKGGNYDKKNYYYQQYF